jgi:hypothetical protein
MVMSKQLLPSRKWLVLVEVTDTGNRSYHGKPQYCHLTKTEIRREISLQNNWSHGVMARTLVAYELEVSNAPNNRRPT